MKTFDDPFDYKPAEWLENLKREKLREKREEKAGRELGTWGGARPGAGRPPLPSKRYYFKVRLTELQAKLLTDDGGGDINQGLKKLIERHL